MKLNRVKEGIRGIKFVMIEGCGDDYKGLEIYAKTSNHN